MVRVARCATADERHAVTIPGRSAARRWPVIICSDAAIDPVIGHQKGDHRMDRVYLKGFGADQMDAILAAAGYNFHLLLNSFLRVLVHLAILNPRISEHPPPRLRRAF
jgi:hypothetical protein